MNAILGARIRSLRDSKGFTQEQMAEKMQCTRQKYARIEKGIVDVSYANLSTISHVLGIGVNEITSAVNDVPQEQMMYRANDNAIDGDTYIFINGMIDTFYAHKRLYNSVRLIDIDE